MRFGSSCRATPLTESRLRSASIAIACACVALGTIVETELASVRAADGEEPRAVALNSRWHARVVDGRHLVLEVRCPTDTAGVRSCIEGLVVPGSAAAAERVRDGGRDPAGRRIAVVPFRSLRDDLKRLVVTSLFPSDRRDGQDWVHVAHRGRLPTYGVGLWQIAEWFTGDGARFDALGRRNGIKGATVEAGHEVRIPEAWLSSAFRSGAPSDDGQLEYGSDRKGPFAGYRLRPGEALYSAVVARFTGRTSSEDVVALAQEIAARSGIDDLRDIPAGYLVRIPLDVLEPEFLPPGHPRRVEAEALRAAVDRSVAEATFPEARGLSGVVVILDPGHGGRDVGTEKHGMWEHDYIYDVSCRIKRRLERHTGARVLMTLEDRETGFEPSEGDRLVKNFGGTVLTDPPYRADERGEARIATNLRWYLSNSLYRGLVADGVDRDRVVFISMHADSRHPSLRGAMVYVPGAAYRKRAESHRGEPYDRIRQVREKRTVKFSYKARVYSEGVSTRLAESILRGFRAESLPVPESKVRPVRNRVIRGRSQFVPAVIRANEVPAKVLVEAVNLANRHDAELLSKAANRERIANAVVRGLFDYFGDPTPTEIASRVAAP